MRDLSFLLFRLGLGGFMFFQHGFVKWKNFSENPASFMTLPYLTPEITFYMAVFAEGVCAVLVMAGFLSRLAALVLLVTMGVAAFVVLDGQPFEKRELSLLFALGFGLIAANGPGDYSIDRMFWKLRR